MDAGLAKVLNSTVGTDKFKSLDELFLSHKSITASSEVYQYFPEEFQNMEWKNPGEDVIKEVCSFNLPLDGSAYVNVRAYYSSNMNAWVDVFIYKNGVQHRVETFVNGEGYNDPAGVDLLLNGTKEDVFTVGVGCNESGSGKIHLCLQTIKATVKTEKTFEVTSLL